MRQEVTKAVVGGYCRLQMPLSLALAVQETVARHRRPGGGVPPDGMSHRGVSPPLPMHPYPPPPGMHWKGRDRRGGPGSG